MFPVLPHKKGSIRLAGLVDDSIVDGPGIRFTVFTQGCAHGCPGCHNPDTHAFEGGYDADIDAIVAKAFANPLLSGITLSGGDPLYQTEACLELAQKIRGHGLDILVYTGFVWEDLLKKSQTDEVLRAFLKSSDYLIDGPYIKAQRDLTLHFRGSANQRMINVQKSLNSQHVVLMDW